MEEGKTETRKRKESKNGIKKVTKGRDAMEN